MTTSAVFANLGNENLPEGSSRVQVLMRIPSSDGRGHMMRAINRVGKTLAPSTNNQTASAVQGKKREVVGAWNSASYTLKDGELICVRVLVNYKDTRERRYVMFARVRAEAAHRTLKLQTLSCPQNDPQRTLLSGRFDIIPFEEIVETYGEPDPLVKADYERSEQDWGVITINEPEIKSRPLLTGREVDLGGTTHRVRSVKRRRNIQL